MPLSPNEEYLAKHCYGYGRWDACYWFIGPEQGMGSETIDRRAEVFRAADRDRDGLCDSREFHKGIGEIRWHEIILSTGRVKLQGTWKYLISILMAFEGDIPNAQSKSDYQRINLGMESLELGETCVIELAGLPSKNLNTSIKREKKRPYEDRERLSKILEMRVDHIAAKIRQNNPKFVVMYGFSDENKKYWAAISGTDLQMGVPMKVGKSVFLADRHPLYTKCQYWTKLGEKMRKISEQND